MICIPHNPVLLVTPPGHTSMFPEGHDTGAWQEVRVDTVGEVMREVLIRKPGALVLNACDTSAGNVTRTFTLNVITAVRQRSTSPVVVVIGAADDPDLEPAVRRAGASVYLPTSMHKVRHTFRRFLDATLTRADPERVHGPPASGVPPR